MGKLTREISNGLLIEPSVARLHPSFGVRAFDAKVEQYVSLTETDLAGSWLALDEDEQRRLEDIFYTSVCEAIVTNGEEARLLANISDEVVQQRLTKVLGASLDTSGWTEISYSKHAFLTLLTGNIDRLLLVEGGRVLVSVVDTWDGMFLHPVDKKTWSTLSKSGFPG